jgi:hypothetical protein
MASDPPAAVPDRSIAARVMTLRLFGGSRICGVPLLSQRIITTLPSVRVAVPKMIPLSATNVATLD